MPDERRGEFRFSAGVPGKKRTDIPPGKRAATDD
jgi:hypothetical protein